MAGITGKIDRALSVNSTMKEGWIIDSGETCHMTHNLHRLHSVCNFPDHLNRSVHLPNGETVSVTHSGSYKTLGGDLLKNVLVVPTFKFDLLSVSQLTKQLHCSVNFFPEFVVFHDLSNGKVKGIGKEVDGLYYLSSKKNYMEKIRIMR